MASFNTLCCAAKGRLRQKKLDRSNKIRQWAQKGLGGPRAWALKEAACDKWTRHCPGWRIKNWAFNKPQCPCSACPPGGCSLPAWLAARSAQQLPPWRVSRRPGRCSAPRWRLRSQTGTHSFKKITVCSFSDMQTNKAKDAFRLSASDKEYPLSRHYQGLGLNTCRFNEAPSACRWQY